MTPNTVANHGQRHQFASDNAEAIRIVGQAHFRPKMLPYLLKGGHFRQVGAVFILR